MAKNFKREEYCAKKGLSASQAEFAHKRKAVEDEFGESFESVILGFAKDGESMSSTASILDYSPSAFTELLRREGLAEYFVNRKSGCSHERLQRALVRIRELEAQLARAKTI